MNNSLERLIAGIIATLRTDVIPNVTDAYARGQAIGVAPGRGNNHEADARGTRDRQRVRARVRQQVDG